MLREHLTQDHGAASRKTEEIQMQVDWFWSKLDLKSGANLLDVTCGPGLYATRFAQKGVNVTGVDFSPASLEHAQEIGRASCRERV